MYQFQRGLAAKEGFLDVCDFSTAVVMVSRVKVLCAGVFETSVGCVFCVCCLTLVSDHSVSDGLPRLLAILLLLLRKRFGSCCGGKLKVLDFLMLHGLTKAGSLVEEVEMAREMR